MPGHPNETTREHAGRHDGTGHSNCGPTTATPGPHDGGALVGILALGVPMRVNVLTNVFPWLIPYQQSLELSRLVLLDAPAPNAESWFSGRAFRLGHRARRTGGILAYAGADM